MFAAFDLGDIDSILSQSFTDFLVILVDDGSPDRCGAICDDYAMRDHRIRVIHQKNAKLAAARNAGIEIAQGEWIVFVDSDDYLHKDYLKILLSGAIEDTDIVICGFRYISNEKAMDSGYSKAEFRSLSIDDVYKDHHARTHAWGRLIRRCAIGELRYISGTEPVEDICFNELLFRNDLKIRMTEAELYYYCMRSNSASNTPMGAGILNAAAVLLEYLKKLDDAETRERMIKRCYKCVLSARYSEMFSMDCRDTQKRCQALLKQLAVYLPELKMKDRLTLWMFSVCPFAYRAWRVLGDPSLLKYERDCKRARNERRKQNKNRTGNA